MPHARRVNRRTAFRTTANLNVHDKSLQKPGLGRDLSRALCTPGTSVGIAPKDDPAPCSLKNQKWVAGRKWVFESHHRVARVHPPPVAPSGPPPLVPRRQLVPCFLMYCAPGVRYAMPSHFLTVFQRSSVFLKIVLDSCRCVVYPSGDFTSFGGRGHAFEAPLYPGGARSYLRPLRRAYQLSQV